jgi:serine/threonine protein kinase
VRYIDFFQTQDSLHIILEFIENGSLHDIVAQYGKFPEALTAIYIAQVLRGLAYLHDKSIIHRDIKVWHSV